MRKNAFSVNSEAETDAANEHVPLLTIKETAALLRICTRTVHRLIKAKKLRARRVGHAVRIATKDIQELIDAPFRTRGARRGHMDE